MNTQDFKKNSRDNMFRCPYCFKLYADSECTRDPNTGEFICPDVNCSAPFIQPDLELPTQ